MTVGADLRTELITNAKTQPLVGDRVQPKRVDPALAFPQIAYHQISAVRQYSHSGDSGLQSPRLQLDIWAKDPDTAEAVAEAVIEVLSGQRFGGVTFVLILDERDDHEPATGLYRRIVDAMPHMEN